LKNLHHQGEWVQWCIHAMFFVGKKGNLILLCVPHLFHWPGKLVNEADSDYKICWKALRMSACFRLFT